MTLQQVLDDIVQQLPRWSSDGLNEAQTSQVIILRLLQALGYDIWDPEEVFSQELGNAGIPDFIVSWQGERRFVIEVKRLTSTLDNKMKTQAVSYANNHAIRWAVLTNGVEWLFFDSFMQNRQAHNRLILTLHLNNLDPQLLAQYFERLLDVSVWAKPKDAIESIAMDIRSHIELNNQLQPLVKDFENLLREYTIQNFEAGLKLASRLHIWTEESQQLVFENLDTFRDLIENFDTNSESSLEPRNIENVLAPDTLVGALVLGIQKTSPSKQKGNSSGLEARLNGELLEAQSWRDIHAGIAEVFVLLDRTKTLEDNSFVYANVKERRMGNGKSYSSSSYRKLSNGKFLYLHYGAKDHRRHSNKLLKLLDAPPGLIKVRFDDKKYSLP